jgi:hypothetical protein
MDIPTCNYKYLDNEFYVKSIKNDNYVPYVFGFIISISVIGLLITTFNIKNEYTQRKNNKIKFILYIILILIFLGLLGYSSYEIVIYNIKDLTKTYTDDELLRPCYSKDTKKIIGIQLNGLILQEGGLSFYSNNNSITSNQSYQDPYNTRSSNSSSTTTGNATPDSTTLNSNADSTSTLGNNITIANNSSPPTSTIGLINLQQSSQNSSGTTDQQILGTIEDGGSLIVSGQ